MGGGRGARVAGEGSAGGDAGEEGPTYRMAGGLLPRSADEAFGARITYRGRHCADLAIVGAPGGGGGDRPPRAFRRVAPQRDGRATFLLERDALGSRRAGRA